MIISDDKDDKHFICRYWISSVHISLDIDEATSKPNKRVSGVLVNYWSE